MTAHREPGYEATVKVTLMMFVTLFSCLHSTDPDFLVGFEVATLSWGYLVDRAATLDINLAKELSRIPSVLFVCNSVKSCVISYSFCSSSVPYPSSVPFHPYSVPFYLVLFHVTYPGSISLSLFCFIADFPGVKQHSASSERGEPHIPGRIMLNVWRLLKHEVALNIYTFENLAFHVLHQRIPLFNFQTLTSWYEHRTKLYR